MKMIVKDRIEEVEEEAEEAVVGEEDVVEEEEVDLEAETLVETGVETVIVIEVTVTVIVGVMATKIEETIVRGKAYKKTGLADSRDICIFDCYFLSDFYLWFKS